MCISTAPCCRAHCSAQRHNRRAVVALRYGGSTHHIASAPTSSPVSGEGSSTTPITPTSPAVVCATKHPWSSITHAMVVASCPAFGRTRDP